MRFVSELIDDRSIAVDTARSYFGVASRWDLRKTGIGFAAGVCIKRLGEMGRLTSPCLCGVPRAGESGV